MLAGIFPILWFFTLGNPNPDLLKPSEVPGITTFCGVEITITEKGKEKIREYKKKLYENPVYFNAAVDRGDTYLPFIEEALADIGAPDDLKYLAMQESNLKADAVSTSNAVGFWQFKEDVGKEAGLKINEKVDERKHIYRSSIAAASYISRVNRNYDNWLYAIISYYEGTTGSVNYTSVENYGKKTMVIDENTHWYLLKTIAYKLTYEDALNITFQPNLWLEPVAVTGPASAKEIASKYNLSEEVFLEYNKWILSKEIPSGELFTCYIPHTSDLYRNHTPDPNKAFAGKEIVSTKVVPKVKSEPNAPPVNPEVQPSPVIPPSFVPVSKEKDASLVIDLQPERYVEINLEDDLYYGEEAMLSDVRPEYILYNGNQSLQDLALYFGITYTNLMNWNGTSVNQEPKKGSIVYLQKPKKSRFHIVEEGESLVTIAKQHRTSVSKIQKKNRMDKNDFKIYRGQRLNLKESVNKNDKIIILTHNLWKTVAVNTPVQQTDSPFPAPAVTDLPEKKNTLVSPQSVTVAMDTIIVRDTIFPNPSPLKSRWLEHTVAANETLWAISQKYKSTVDIIKKANDLKSDALSPGQKLRIFTTLPDFQEYREGYYHKVLSGETLEKISGRYGVPSFQLAKINEITSPELRPGQILLIIKE